MTRDSGLEPVRPLAFAGSWYAADPDRLAREVDRYLAAAGAAPSPPIALLAPHAGLRYSGPVAAFAYACLRAQPPARAVLVGPSHYAAFHGCALLQRGSLATPWGPLPIETGTAAALAARSPLLAHEHRMHHEREHSLELQLPFLARLCPGLPVVPILMGEQSRETAFELADALGDVLGAAGRVLLVASSDLSHFRDADTAAALDGVVLRHVERFDAGGLMAALEVEPQHACGGGPLVAVMRAATRMGASVGRVLRYGDSGDVTGDKRQVVGYASAGFFASGIS